MSLSVAGADIANNALTAVALRASLHSADPGVTGASEIAGGTPAYSREVIAWDPSAVGVSGLTGDAVFDVPAGTTVTHAGFWTVGGVFLGGQALTTPETFVVQGNLTLDEASTLAIA